jgi:sugar/nucleoside kinase (ribokinase family)
MNGGALRLTPRRLVVTGTVIVDILLYLDEFPEPGEAAIASRAVVAAGAGYNLLAGAARLGLPAAYAGLVGSGPFGTIVRRALADIAVPVLLAARDGGDTGFDVGLVRTTIPGQPTFIGSPGVESDVALGDLRDLAVGPGDAVYLSGYDLWYPKAGAAWAEWTAGLGAECLLIFDPGPLAGQIEATRLDAAIGRADILSLNAAEAAVLADGHDPAALAGALTHRVPAPGWVVLRAGADGCWIAGHDTAPRHVQPRAATVVDPTGAGDIHVATMIARLAAGQDIAEAARWANIAASLAVERTGPGAGPTARELASAVAQADRQQVQTCHDEREVR